MKKKLLSLIAGFLLLFASSVDAAYYIRAFIAHSGGGSGAMDAISCSSLNDNDLGLVFDVSANAMFFYKYDNDGTTAEDTTHYSVIRPDNYATCSQGNWLLFSSMNFAPGTSPSWSFRDSDSPNTNKTVGQITIDYIDGGAGSANADICLKVLQNGDGTSMTTVLCFDESDDAWETTKDISTTGYLKGKLSNVANSGTSAYTVTQAQAEAGTFFLTTNAATTTYTLPSAVAGYVICAKMGQGVTQILRFDTDGTDYIVMPDGNRTSAAGDYYGCTADPSNQLCAVTFNDTDWYITSEVGTCAEE